MSDEKIGERIRRYRLASKLTQQEFADRIGVTGASVSAYENEIRYPSLDTVVRIARVFGITTDELLTGKIEIVNIDVSGLTIEQRSMVVEMVHILEEYNELKSENK